MIRQIANTQLLPFLNRLNACSEALEWAEEYKSKPESAWRECQRGDWMLWLICQFAGQPESDERKRLVLCACECARLAPPIGREDWEQARLDCLSVTERWAKGEEGITIQQVRKARADAAAVYAAANAAYVDYVAADVANAAAYVAYAAANAAAHVAADAARKETLAQAAAIVRRHYPWDEIKHLLEQP